jgi:hypothetical protein
VSTQRAVATFYLKSSTCESHLVSRSEGEFIGSSCWCESIEHSQPAFNGRRGSGERRRGLVPANGVLAFQSHKVAALPKTSADDRLRVKTEHPFLGPSVRIRQART